MTNYFDISELTASDTAKAKGINNKPSLEVCDNLHILIAECLNPIRQAFGKAIRVTSGYRCEKLNKAVGGKENSQHLKGEAADLIGKTDEETRRIFEIARALGNFDQLLFERSGSKRWVHISYKKTGNRKQAIYNYNV